MNDNVFGSISDIDAKLDAEFGEVANEPDTDLNDADLETDTGVDDSSLSKDDEKVDDDQEVEEPQNEKSSNDDEPKAETKEHHAFADLRAQNSTLKKEKEALEGDVNFLKDLAASYGYTDVSAFQKAYKEAKAQQEAKEKGVDPILYKQNMEQRERIEALEKQREQDLMDRKLERFKSALDTASQLYKIDQTEIFDRLEKSGLSAETILSVDNPKLLIDGLLVDKISANAKQSQIEDIKNMKDLVEDKNETGGVDKTITIDSLLKEDLAKYKADNFFE